MNTVLCDAIRRRVRLEPEYDSLRRIVEPYCHGMAKTGKLSDGKKELLACRSRRCSLVA
jgi:hypothetical protein